MVFLLQLSSTVNAMPLPFELDAAGYLEPGKGSYVKLRIAVAYDDLLFLKRDASYVATYAVSYRISDSEGNRVDSGRLSGRVEVFDFEETNTRKSHAREEIILSVPAGTYTIRLSVEDKETRRRGTREETVLVPGEKDGDIQLSSIILSGCEYRRDTLSDTLPSQCGLIRVVAEVYSPIDSIPNMTVPAHVRIVDANDDIRAETIDSIAVSKSVTTLEIPVDISNLEPGTYILYLILDPDDNAVEMTRTFIIPWSILGMVNEEDDALRLLNYIADKEDVKAFKKTPDDEKQAFWVQYWTSSDPVTSTPWNERIALYERRIMYSNDKFSSFEEGWKTDMGMIHIIFGAPDEIERHPFDLDSKPYQIWTYYSLGRQFVFVDRNGFGRYDLVYGDYSRR